MAAFCPPVKPLFSVSGISLVTWLLVRSSATDPSVEALSTHTTSAGGGASVPIAASVAGRVRSLFQVTMVMATLGTAQG